MDVERDASWVEVLDGDWSGPLRLRVRGRSMWPTLQPGDRVTVVRAAATDLRPGDWALLRGRGDVFLHRLLGFTREGLLLAKGDARRALDCPWPREAVVGRAVAFTRGERTIPVSSSSLRQRAWTGVHRLVAASWSLLRRAGLLALALLLLGTATARAAVDLIEGSLQAIPEEQAIRVTWETASEVDALGFYVRRTVQGGTYERITGLIAAYGDIVGAYYEIVDTDVEMGPTYFYQLEAVDVFGVSEFYGPVTASLVPPATETAVPTATPTPSATPTATLTPTPSPSATASASDDDPRSDPGSDPAPGSGPDPGSGPSSGPGSSPAGGQGGPLPAAATRAPRFPGYVSPSQPPAPTSTPSSTPADPAAQAAALGPEPTGSSAGSSPGSAATARPGSAAGTSTPTPTPVPPGYPVEEQGAPPCWLLLVLIVAGCVLLALGVREWKKRR